MDGIPKIGNVGGLDELGPATRPSKSTGEAFTEALKDAIESVEGLQKESEAAQQAFASGEDVELHDVLIKVEEADIAFRAMMEIRTKLVEAYRDVIRMATLNGARALGLGDETGSLVAGKWADITCVDMDRLNTRPVYDAASQVVYAAGRDQVSDVWVAGRHLVAEGSLVAVDEKELLGRTRDWQRRIAASEEETTDD